MTNETQRSTAADVVVVGAGFSGLYLIYRLRELGFSVRVIERAPDVGGTWYWNRYPGARCDIESIDYQYSFSPELVAEWRWSERYAAQPEILRYLEYVADRFDLRRDIDFGVAVTSMNFDSATSRWSIMTDSAATYSAQFVVMATGNLSVINQPDFPGLNEFEGHRFHTGAWPLEPIDFSGLRVAVIGTGSSGIQTIPTVARQADQLYVIQRTPNYSMPAHNRPLEEDEWEAEVEGFPVRRRLCELSEAGTPLPPATKRATEVTSDERRQRYEEGWARGGISALSGAFTDMFSDEIANGYAQDFARERIREIVRDPAVAELLCPTHDIGTKRTCTDTGYFETYNRPNVELINAREHPIECFTATGLRVGDREIAVDAIIVATGFDAITGSLGQIEIRGQDGALLSDAWQYGPRTLLGVQVAGFPNLFLITGPASPSVLSNMVVSIEQHVEWVTDLLAHVRSIGASAVEASAEAQAEWMDHVDELAAQTLYPRANSWYVGANMPGRRRQFTVYLAGCGPYRAHADAVASNNYRGFVFSNPGGFVIGKDDT